MSRSPVQGLSQHLYRAAFDEHPQPMWMYDGDDLSVLAGNAAAMRLYGHSADELGQMHVFELHSSADAERAIAYYRDVDGAQGRKRAWTHVRKDGSTLEVETMVARLPDATNVRLAVAEQACVAEDWVFELDVHGTFTMCGPAVSQLLGYTPEELLGRHFTILYFPESHEKVAQFYSRIVAARSGWTDLVQRLRHKDGSECYVEASAVPVLDGDGNLTGFRGTDRDVTSRARFEQRVRYGSRRDPLTGLPNHLYFQERLGEVLALGGAQTAVLFIGVDHLELVNETFGHAVGDNALQVIASMIRSVAGDDDNAARLGGNELALLLPNAGGLAEAQRLARTIIDAISVPLMLDGNHVHVSATVGIALAPFDGDQAAALMRNAEHALHRARDLGRGRVQHFTAEMQRQQATQAALESDLRRALDRRELVLHYQPIYESRAWTVVGIEALLRWNHPVRGLLAPDTFIGLAERTGQIHAIGAWALRQACVDLLHLRAATGRDLRVSVNLSARQLQEPELIDTVRAIVTETGLDPRQLELEITESVAMQNAEATLTTLRALKEMGLSLAVDDFGTGFSSLLYLTRFPIDTVKVDRQFVGNVTTDPNAAAVVGAVVALAHSLQLKTVAEGVETADQRDFLLSHLCAEMQGFLLGRPVALEELALGVGR